MEIRTIFLILVIFLHEVNLQDLFQQPIPPTSEVGFCVCQRFPLRIGVLDRLLVSSNHGIKFFFYSRSSLGGRGIEITTGDIQTLTRSGFREGRQLTFVIHGWTEENTNSNWMYSLKDALLRRSDMNVILVDWSSLSKRRYDLSASYVILTGKVVVAFLEFLKENFPRFSGEQVHLIGFSMGAHIAGVTGHRFPGIARITGLDPAAPAFECVNLYNRLDREDASFVDIIHTNAGCLSQGHMGYRTPMGHADFYVNGGGPQPSCSEFFTDTLAELRISSNSYVCHHHRSIQYFQESIEAQQTPYAFLCSDYETFKKGDCLRNNRAVFGYRASSLDLPGFGMEVPQPFTYFLVTQDQSLFLSKHLALEVELGTNGDSRARGDFLLYVNGGRSRESTKINLLKDGERINQGDTVSAMLAIPQSTDVRDINVMLSYESSSWINIAIFNGFLDVIRVNIRDTSTEQQYCVMRRESLRTSQKLNRRPTIGAC